MDNRTRELVEELESTHRLAPAGYEYLIAHRDDEAACLLADRAVAARHAVYGNAVFVRGLVEFSNVCANDCFYCGIRAGNAACRRYRLSAEEMLACAARGYTLGIRTFVFQGGEDPRGTDDLLCGVIAEVKGRYPDCAVTLSVGERDRAVYQRFREAGADRFLLRHETADRDHYARLHPADMSFDHRMGCLEDLRALGFAVGCGFMVGSPYQSTATLAADLAFIVRFQPEMCGIGPFIPHRSTPLADEEGGSVELTCYLLSIIRLICPDILLPATTALDTADSHGYEKGMRAGANVVMPNITPTSVRSDYELYDGKAERDNDIVHSLRALDAQMSAIGYRIVTDRGDCRRFTGS